MAGFIIVIWVLGLIMRLQDILNGKIIIHPFSTEEIRIISITPVTVRVWKYAWIEFLFLISVPIAFLIPITRLFIFIIWLFKFIINKIQGKPNN